MANMTSPATPAKTGFWGWLGARQKAIVAGAALALTILVGMYAGHTPHWVAIVVAAAGFLGVHQIPNVTGRKP